MVGKTHWTIRQWKLDLIANDGVLPESKQGSYQRSGVLWQSEELNLRVREYFRLNAAVKGTLNLTAAAFCRWVNKSLLPNSTLEPGFPRKVGVETSCKWLHHLGFEVLSVSKGIFIDGHERDVVEARKLFLRKMAKIFVCILPPLPLLKQPTHCQVILIHQLLNNDRKQLYSFTMRALSCRTRINRPNEGRRGNRCFDQKARELVSWYQTSSMNTHRLPCFF